MIAPEVFYRVELEDFADDAGQSWLPWGRFDIDTAGEELREVVADVRREYPHREVRVVRVEITQTVVIPGILS